ncbi:hypothetical protein Poly51_33720 [Rubripirellula tenax]|uniref:Uncharacterized protein n=2 Tax=Rubripirellula tenax TaxID=2528015 RepID=A0A5C6EYD8_9BACT|nr:hypothetical protein Poly51_33720 [Rubripirellula tenax]
MATIAIVRSNQLAVQRVDATRSAVQGRVFADGLMQRSLAMLRLDPTLSGEIREKGSSSAHWIELRPMSKTTTMVQVFLYEGSKTPAITRVIDVEALAKGSSSSVGSTGGIKPSSPTIVKASSK